LVIVYPGINNDPDFATTVPFTLYTKLFFILLFAGIYACFRYVVFGEVYWAHIPVYILNKVMAVGAVFTMMISAIGHLQKRRETARNWGVIAFHLTAYHIVLSLMILTPAYYKQFFWRGLLTFNAELVMSFGAYCFVMLFLSKHNTASMYYFKLLATFSVGLHLYLMAYSGWLRPWQWNGYMPPISLWSFIFVVTAFVIYLRPGQPLKKPAHH
jgi:hypothetical protein